MEKRCSFELFKSNVCHWLKEEGDIDFLIQVLESDLIRKYYNRKWYLESFYLLGMFDYICRINDAPICSEYDDLRRQRMQEIIYVPDGKGEIDMCKAVKAVSYTHLTLPTT